MKSRVAVLISGRGSNLAALIDAARTPDYPAEIALVISNVAGAAGIEVARDAGIATKIIPHQDYASREAFDAEIERALEAARIDIVCLAGFMRMLSDGFAARWRGHMLNIHPSLLPQFRGLNAQAQALAAGVRSSGCTVHFVVPELDAGPTIAQTEVRILPGDTVETLSARIREEEHRLYPQALRLAAEGRAKLR